MKQQKKKSDITIGLDLGDRRHRFCVLDKSGGLLEEGSVRNERVFLAQLSERYPGALVVVEAGCHSPWISRYLQQQGCRVLIANPRKLRAIYQHERKSDRRDAQMLARIGRLDPALLYPVRHGTAEAQGPDPLPKRARRRRLRGLMSKTRSKWAERSTTAHLQMWRRLPAPIAR